MRDLTIVTCAFLFVATTACGSNDPAPANAIQRDAATGTDANQAAPAMEAGAQEAAASPPCLVPEGTPNNEQGIGGFCMSSADCMSEAGVRLCTADFGIEPKFCTTFCASDTECGTGAYCAHAAQGDGCTPSSCRPPIE